MKKHKSFSLPIFLIVFTLCLRTNTLTGISKETEKKVQKEIAEQQKSLENILYLDLKDGRVTIEMLPSVAPKHVERIRTLVRDKFYNGIVFHRVIDNFMAQTGDPTGTGGGGSSLPNVEAEFSQEKFTRGAVGMARSSAPNSANSQFFIMFRDSSHLNGQYTLWGRVTEGMEHVDNIKRGEPPVGPDKIIQVVIASDEVKKEEEEE